MEFVQAAADPGVVRVRSDQSGGCGHRDVRAGVERQVAQQRLCRVRQFGVREAERGDELAVVELVQRVGRLGQPVQQMAQGPGLPVPEAAGEPVEEKGWQPAARITSASASGAPETRAAPAIRVKRAAASSSDSPSTRSEEVPSSPASRLRLVTIARQVAAPGSSGRTWAASRALSSTTSTR